MPSPLWHPPVVIAAYYRLRVKRKPHRQITLRPVPQREKTAVPAGKSRLENAEGHQTRSRRILRTFRPEIGEELIRVLRPTIRSSTERISVLRPDKSYFEEL
jgi:hypothetical protein